MLKNLSNGAIITPENRIPAMVVSADIREGKNGQYITGALRDKESSLDFKVWNATGLTSVIAAGNIIEITSAKVSEWQGVLQMSIDGASVISLDRAKDLGVVPTSAYPFSKLMDSWSYVVTTHIETTNSRMATLIKTVQQTKIWDKFVHMPAAKGMHHAYIHGLLEHSINTAIVSLQLANHTVPGFTLNIPVMLTAALLHDIGKVLEYETNQLHLITEYGIDGSLMGHLFMGASLLRNMSKTIENGPTKEEMDLLTHIILSHHGWKSNGFGSVTDPATAEAFIVSQADDLEAKLNAISGALTGVPQKSMVAIPALGRTFFNY